MRKNVFDRGAPIGIECAATGVVMVGVSSGFRAQESAGASRQSDAIMYERVPPESYSEDARNEFETGEAPGSLFRVEAGVKFRAEGRGAFFKRRL